MTKLKVHILFWTIACSFFMNVTQFSQVAHADDKPIVIYTSSDAHVLEYMKDSLQKKFPKYNIIVEYVNSGNHAAKLKVEGVNTLCDITFDLNFEYLTLIEDVLADLPYDFSMFVEDAIPTSKKYSPTQRTGMTIVVNPEVLKEKGLPTPVTYADLLKPEYKDLISMPNPKTSSGAYAFLKSLVNAWGEEKAFAYFDKLSENILQFTTSGSAPVNALMLGEVAIGFAITSQTVTEINKGANLKIVRLDVGDPYILFGFGVVKGKEKRKRVMEVADYLNNEFIPERVRLYYPERLYKDTSFSPPNYPTDIVYADMSKGGIEEKQRLLDKWEY